MPTGKSCCSKDSSTQAITPRRRKNGWSRPWNFMQFFSWIIITILAAISTYVAVPLPFFPLVPTFVLFLHVWVIFWIFLLTSIDPGDGPRDVVPAKFDRKKHSHVIENKYCHVCQRKV
ncbi:zinc fingerDHHC-type containing 11-like protein [Aphelenchoides avenae]|nr:zinc fingerDHHC-type containing 11-like protein [Aphelenchus avenae]